MWDVLGRMCYDCHRVVGVGHITIKSNACFTFCFNCGILISHQATVPFGSISHKKNSLSIGCSGNALIIPAISSAPAPLFPLIHLLTVVFDTPAFIANLFCDQFFSFISCTMYSLLGFNYTPPLSFFVPFWLHLQFYQIMLPYVNYFRLNSLPLGNTYCIIVYVDVKYVT